MRISTRRKAVTAFGGVWHTIAAGMRDWFGHGSSRLARAYLTALLLLYLLSTSGWGDDQPIGGALLLLGCALIGFAIWGRVWSSLYVAGHKTRELVTEGPYALCRHPLYLFSLLGTLGVALGSETLTMPALVLVGFAVHYPRLITREEKRLRRLHGEVYERWATSTSCLVPRTLRLPLEPSLYPAIPGAFRRQVRDAVWFVWAFGLVLGVAILHEHGLLPAPLTLY